MSAEQKKYPRVLIVSHTVLARNTSMGKTMDTYFSGWDRDAIAQLYIQSEIPTDPLCANYFRFTDPDALKSCRAAGRARCSQKPTFARTGRIPWRWET